MFSEIHSGYDTLRQLLTGSNRIITILILILMIIGYWRMFQKAGHAGWLSIIPIANVWVLCKMSFRSGWYALLLLIPIVNIFVLIKLNLNLAAKFGHSWMFAVGLIFLNPIFVMILAFSDARWRER